MELLNLCGVRMSGRTLLRTPLAEAMETACGSPHYAMHRADVMDALARALPAERLHVWHRFTALVDRGEHVEVEFENGTRIAVEAVVGADGIHSTVRRVLLGPENPNFTGCVAYRGLVPAERLAYLDLEVTSQVWMGPGKHFVQSRRLVNFVSIIDQNTWTRESWNDRGEVSDALPAFEGWHSQVRHILEAVDDAFIWTQFDRKPMARWSVGGVTLLGDACHAMLPFMAQRAAQAIEGGATLAECLSQIG